ncbi:MAG TPA: energy transducer TonB [Cyclobacteriaceae bacterium]|nr:energy transducer TonB [Cyclobacteriaceae bacterium]
MKVILFLLIVLTGNMLCAQPGNPQSAAFPGGMPRFYEYQRNAIVYPKKALKKGIKGKVYVEFYIKEDGTIDQQAIRVVSAQEINQTMGGKYAAEVIADESLEAEAIRVIKNSPSWTPGKLYDKPIRQMSVMPVIFNTEIRTKSQ